MDQLNLKVMVSADNLMGDRLRASLDAVNKSPFKDRFRILAGLNFRDAGPGWGAEATAELEEDVKAGAVGIGEVSKSFGMTVLKADGMRLHIHDPSSTRCGTCSRSSGFPVHPHGRTAGVLSTARHARRASLELSLFGDRRNYGPD